MQRKLIDSLEFQTLHFALHLNYEVHGVIRNSWSRIVSLRIYYNEIKDSKKEIMISFALKINQFVGAMLT